MWHTQNVWSHLCYVFILVLVLKIFCFCEEMFLYEQEMDIAYLGRIPSLLRDTIQWDFSSAATRGQCGARRCFQRLTLVGLTPDLLPHSEWGDKRETACVTCLTIYSCFIRFVPNKRLLYCTQLLYNFILLTEIVFGGTRCCFGWFCGQISMCVAKMVVLFLLFCC